MLIRLIGLRPRQLTEAIAPLLDPSLLTASDSAIHSSLTEEEEQVAFHEAEQEEEHHGGLGGAVKGVVGGVGSLVDALAD